MYIKSQEGKKIKVDDDLFDDDNVYEEESTAGEAALRGAGQGLSLGALDEMLAALGTSGASPSQIVAEPKKAADIERAMFQQYEQQLADERALDKKLQDEQGSAYTAGELLGGLVPALGTGGATAAAQVGKTAGKEAIKQAAKLGAKYGGASAAGYSEADNPIDLAKDTALGTALGATAGAGLPLAAKGAMSTAKSIAKIPGKVVDILPRSEMGKAAYKYGKQGKAITEEVVDEDLMTLGKKVVKNIQKKKKDNNLKEVIDQLDELGYRVNTKESINNAIDDMSKLAEQDWGNIQNKDLLPNLMKYAGKDTQTSKLVSKAEKAALKKAVEAQSKAEQALIKGEKKLAQEAVKSGDSLETITDVNRKMDDLDLPLTTPDGQVGGVKGKFKDAEGNEYVKSVLADTTDYQPSIAVKKGPDGRPVVTTKDAGSGKMTALVGDIEKKISNDLSDMKISEVEVLRDTLNRMTKLATGQGSKNDPIMQRAVQLATELKTITDEAVRKGGDHALIDRRAKFSDLFTAEELLNIKNSKAVRRDVDEILKSKEVASKLGFEKGFDSREESKLAKNLLGEDVVTPQMDEQFDLLKKINELRGRGESGERFSKSGLYESAVGGLPNLAGRGVKKVVDTAKKAVSPVTNTIESLSNMSKDRLEALGTSLVSSGSEGNVILGQRLQDALQKTGQARSAAMWSLSQQPAFRELMRREGERMSEDMLQDVGMSQEIDDSLFDDETPYSEEEVENTREPNAVKDIDEGLGHILDVEAGYQAQEEDKGNYLDGKLIGTNRGVTPAAYKAYFGNTPTVEDMQNLTKEQALELYKNDYVNEPGFDQIGDPNLQTALVDYGVNSGTTRAIRALQGIVGANPDGHLGPETLELINNYEGDLRGELMDQRREFLKKIDNPTYEKGWLNRVDHMEEVTAPEVSEEQVEEAEKQIDRVNQQQGSGDNAPISQLDDLLRVINELDLSQEDKDQLEDEAVAMDGYSDGINLKESIRRLSGMS